MQPASTKRVGNKEVWTQELWTMYKIQSDKKIPKTKLALLLNQAELKIISAWRYPGVSPKRDPIPTDILQEIANRGEGEGDIE